MSKRLPQEVIDSWPEVFGDIDVKSVPLEYLNAIHVAFKNSDVWVIDFTKTKSATPEVINAELNELFEEYQDEITNIDFKLDTQKVKKDVQRRTTHFLKKRK